MEGETSSNSIFKNYWFYATIALALILIAVLVNNNGFTGKAVISDQDAGKKVVDFLNNRTNGGVELVKVVDQNSLYEVTVKYQDKEVPIYITKDGENLVQGVFPLNAPAEPAAIDTPTQTPKEVTKSDKPKIELFIMTHCPYGTQSEKAIIPAIKAIGTKADVKIRFVHYFMHGDKEEAETYTQVCIREEQSAKYLDYLSCFLEDGNSTRCLKKVGIDQTKLAACVKDKAKTYYADDSKLSNQYGVQGSPTLIVNGVESSFDRSSVGALSVICSAFNTAPSECTSAKLSATAASPGFGTTESSGTANSAAGGCAAA